ncbi:unnamed protein product, partial [Prorocentrum cordatum]
MRKIRENTSGAPITGKMLCYVSPGTSGKQECRSDWCRLSSPGPDGHCPLAQVTYLANQRAPGLKPPPESLCWNGSREQKDEANRWRMANFAPQPSMAQPATAAPWAAGRPGDAYGREPPDDLLTRGPYGGFLEMATQAGAGAYADERPAPAHAMEAKAPPLGFAASLAASIEYPRSRCHQVVALSFHIYQKLKADLARRPQAATPS